MSFFKRKSVTVTTIADGSATGYIPVDTGRLMSLSYVKTDYADGVDFTVTVDATGEGIWTDTDINASETVYPRAAVHDVAGAPALFADSGEAIVEPIAIAEDRIKIVIADGGNAKSGEFIAVFG